MTLEGLSPSLARQLAARLREDLEGTTRTRTALSIHEVASMVNPETQRTPALDLIAERLTAAAETPGSRLIISMPPQEGKTTMCSVNFPLWMLLRNPDAQIALATYNGTRAEWLGQTLRDTIERTPELGLELSPRSQSKSLFQLEGSRGSVRAVGRGGSMTGYSVDVMVIDDPHKDFADASSAANQAAAWEWFDKVVMTRITPQTPIIILNTRWHERDLIGQIMSSHIAGKWDYLNIPAESEGPGDPLGRPAGTFMRSVRRPTEADWLEQKSQVGSDTWARLYQGRPAPADGEVFKRDHLTFYNEPVRVGKGTPCYQSWDLAFSGGERADFVVGQVWIRVGRKSYLVDQVRGRWDFTDTIREMRALRERWSNTRETLVEAKANGSAAISVLRDAGIPGVVPVTPRESKVARAMAVTPYIEAGDVALPGPGLVDWSDEFVQELLVFPNGRNDDQVDAMVQYLQRSYGQPAPVQNTAYQFDRSY